MCSVSFRTVLVLLVAAAGVCNLAPAEEATVHYVKPGGVGDGSSWANAGALQAVVAAALPGDEVWVAGGVYTAATGPVLTMQADVALYAGFAGTETAREQRNWTIYPTTIDGETQRRCVVGAEGAVLDGFIIRRGFAAKGAGMYNVNASPVVANCTFTANVATDVGGGMYNENASPIVTASTFTWNAAVPFGGGMYTLHGSPTVVNCVFTQNTVSGEGAGMSNHYASPTVINCTFTLNIAATGGSGMSNNNASPMVTNCILWSPAGADFISIEGAPVVTHSCVSGGYEGAGNIDSDPKFVNAPAGNVRLQAASPCIDSGTAAGAPATDIRGVARPQRGGFDMGAYEMAGTGSLRVIISPDSVVAAGARWRRIGTTEWRESGAIESGILIGERTVEFFSVTGWQAPEPVSVMINPEQTTVLSGAAATYTLAVYELTYIAGWGGEILGATHQTVTHGEDGSVVQAVPEDGYRFVNWSDGSAANPRKDLKVTSDITVTANFELDIDPEGETVEGETGEGETEEGEIEGQVEVPGVVSQTLEDATEAILAAGLTRGVVTTRCSNTVPEGAVIAQNPAEGTLVAEASPVDLVVSTGNCPVGCDALRPSNWSNIFLGLLAIIALLVASIFVGEDPFGIFT